MSSPPLSRDPKNIPGSHLTITLIFHEQIQDLPIIYPYQGEVPDRIDLWSDPLDQTPEKIELEQGGSVMCNGT